MKNRKTTGVPRRSVQGTEPVRLIGKDAVRSLGLTKQQAITNLENYGYSFHRKEVPESGDANSYEALAHTSGDVPVRTMNDFLASIRDHASNSYLTQPAFGLYTILKRHAIRRGYRSTAPTVDHSTAILEEVKKYEGMTATVTGNKIHISHEQTPELWFDVNPDAKPADVEKRLRRYEKARAKFVAFKNKMNGEFAFPENEPFEKVVDAAGTLLKNKRRETEKQVRQAEQAHKHNGHAPTKQENNDHAPHEGNGHSAATPEPEPRVLQSERQHGQSEPPPAVTAEAVSQSANGKTMHQRRMTTATSPKPLHEQEQVVLVLDANILLRLAAPRSGGKGTWLDLLRETAKLPNVTIVIPAYVADWEIGRGTSEILPHGRVSRDIPELRSDTEFNRSAQAIRRFLQEAVYAKRGEDGSIVTGLTLGSRGSNVIIWETESCREAFKEIRNAKSIHDEQERQAKISEYNRNSYGEKCIEQFVNREIPFHSPVIILSDDHGYTTGRKYDESFQVEPVGNAGIGDYIDAEMTARGSRIAEVLKRQNLNIDAVTDEIYAHVQSLDNDRKRATDTKDRIFSRREHIGQYFDKKPAPSLKDFISLGVYLQEHDRNSLSPQEKLKMAGNGHAHAHCKVPEGLPEGMPPLVGQFLRRAGLNDIRDVVNALNNAKNLPPRYIGAAPYEAAAVWAILEGRMAIPDRDRFAITFAHAIRTAAQAAGNPVNLEEMTALYKAFNEQIKSGDIAPTGNGNGRGARIA